jgi:hypothetical protein
MNSAMVMGAESLSTVSRLLDEAERISKPLEDFQIAIEVSIEGLPVGRIEYDDDYGAHVFRPSGSFFGTTPLP